MKVLHVSTAITWRGGEQQIAYLIEELQKLGILQKLVCAQNSAMAVYAKKEGFDYASIKKHLAIDPLFARSLKKICNRFEPDVMHVHDSHAHTFAVLSRDLFNNKIPVVVSRRVDFNVGGNWLSRYKYNHKSVKRILCVSDKIKKIVGECIDDKKKLVTVYSGIDTDRFARGNTILRDTYKIPVDELLIGNVAALAPHKDYPTFLDTVEILKDKIKARYLIIGEGELRSQIQNQIMERNLQDQIILTGFRNDLEKTLPELDIFLTTSKTEGLGTSILDAFAAEVPVIATAAGGIPEIVAHKETGLLAPVGDAAELADQVTRLINDPGLKNELVTNAKRQVKHFSKEVTAKKTLDVYNELLQGTA